METLNYRRAEKSEKAFEENPKARSQINNKKNSSNNSIYILFYGESSKSISQKCIIKYE